MSLINPLLYSQTAPRDPNAPPSRDLGKNDFLNLMMVQLRNQDPLNVQEDKEFIAQMAQFSTLEQTTNLTQAIEGLVGFQQLTQGSLLIGREIEALDPEADAAGASDPMVRGMVSETRLVDGQTQLLVGDRTVRIQDVLRVR
jgi:flagellar basal-body rod modification protein FlgD